MTRPEALALLDGMGLSKPNSRGCWCETYNEDTKRLCTCGHAVTRYWLEWGWQNGVKLERRLCEACKRKEDAVANV